MDRDKITAIQYHRGTIHPNGRLFDPAHRWDPGHRPRFRKDYPGADAFELPSPHREIGVAIWEALEWTGDKANSRELTLRELSTLLHYSNGITKRIKRPSWDRRIPFRACACTGALYHIEIYVLTGEMGQLPAGVYYYDPEPHALMKVRDRDHRSWLGEAAGNDGVVAGAQAALVFTDVYWRNAIKYQAREYRHAWWDLGTMLANTLAVASALKQRTTVVLGFLEAEVGELLGIQADPEYPLALMPLGARSGPISSGDRHQAAAHASRQQGFRTSYPPVEAIQAAARIGDDMSLELWRQAARDLEAYPTADASSEIGLPAASADPPDLLSVIRRRGSTRQFDRAAISSPDLNILLQAATTPAFSTDLGLALGGQVSKPYLLVNQVDGLASGSYRWQGELIELERISEAANRGISAHLALGQDLGGDAAANIYFLVDLEHIVERLGDRGYRIAQLDASVAAGRIYLAAYALGFGATGLTFYDDEVVKHFDTAGRDDDVMFLIAVGHPGY